MIVFGSARLGWVGVAQRRWEKAPEGPVDFESVSSAGEDAILRVEFQEHAFGTRLKTSRGIAPMTQAGRLDLTKGGCSDRARKRVVPIDFARPFSIVYNKMSGGVGEAQYELDESVFCRLRPEKGCLATRLGDPVRSDCYVCWWC